jgi:hypothetical protein
VALEQKRKLRVTVLSNICGSRTDAMVAKMFNEKERLLANEATLTASMLSSGLHALRKANTFQKGLFYQAFFSLSIGIERLLKIIIIAQYRCKTKGEFPANKQLKSYGHDLLKLSEIVGTVNYKKDIHKEILSFLSKFARSSRYYNIDVIADDKGNNVDPLSEWAEIQNKIIKDCGKKKVWLNKELLAKSLDEVAVVVFHDMMGNEINSCLGILEESENMDLIQGYSVLHVYEIIMGLVKIIHRLENEKYMLPILSEFFSYYSDYWSSYQIRNKKNWINITK